MGRRNGLTALGFGAGLLSLAGASVAWACSSLAPSAYVSANPGEATAGQQVQVSTHYMNQMVGSDARLIWADGYGNYISTFTGIPATDSTTTVTIPQAAPGYYYINVYDGAYRATPTELTIPAPAGQTMPSKPPGYGPPDTSTHSVGGGQPRNSAPAPAPVAAAPVASQPQPQAQPQQGSAPAAVKSAPAPQGSTIAPKAVVNSAASAPASATSATPIEGAPVQPAAGGNVPANKVLGDLWGGFAKGKTNSQAPSLIGTPDSGPGVGLAVGMGTAGLVALFAGFGIAEVRRSRAVATSTIE